MLADEYSNNSNKDYSFSEFKIDFLGILTILCYIVFIISILMKFIPIKDLSWFKLGMGKYLGIASIFAILSIFYKNYFAAFFISLFATFFSFHEIIIFYDSYAIELGKELGDDGLFRSVIEIFIKEIGGNPEYGGFWAILSSSLSLIFVSLGWMKNIFFGKYKTSN